MEGVQNLPPHQQQEFMKHLENMQMKDGLLYVLRLYLCWGGGRLLNTSVAHSHLDHLLLWPLLVILRFYNNLVNRCFETCVTSFRSKQLDKNETGCIENCANRYLKSMQRTTVRFQEHQASQSKSA